ncbi:PREDICTED: tRNA (adenine(58)-N(1))-methyltransferase non-catalytic subunit trm6 [Tarenaya hassleriana]|uniref:tRNA (adenine(58)-N(1))-methyltransferase non-catalytic subunit trm6 n=1 Tax=Tarenaya hassleriana TaxID=28532 RepID=UPI00053C7982|nr:PREDICTED: tRNA (adenine(58)-N(1))-methyltransferase non-catalytic subunit trm6 [Tarenaya hassleriana]
MSESNSRHDSDRNPNPRVTWDGCSVLLDINDGDRLVFARLSGGAKLKIGNKNYSLQPLIGAPFGSLFQVENETKGSCLSRVIPTKEESNNQNEGDGLLIDESRDNREIVDNNQAQSLTGEEIEAMRRQGAKGDEIVEALIANSKTFEKKFQLSQEKYRLKKQKKYAPKVLIRRPFARSICEAYFKKYPVRIGFLRIDALSLLLSMANVTAHSDVLLVDMVGGLVTGAVAERLGGTGYVCNTYRGSSPYPLEIVRMFNFSDGVLERIVRSSLSDLSSSEALTLEENNQRGAPDTENIVKDISTSDNVKEISLTSEETVDTVPEMTFPASKVSKAPKAGAKASKEAVQMWKENGFSSLIIAAPEQDAWSLAKDLLPLLSYSAPFAIYHQYLQPLATCMHNLQQEKMAINLQISEPWIREYQVLPSRTHPHMQMSSFGGYVLSGTRISSS